MKFLTQLRTSWTNFWKNLQRIRNIFFFNYRTTLTVNFSDTAATKNSEVEAFYNWWLKCKKFWSRLQLFENFLNATHRCLHNIRWEQDLFQCPLVFLRSDLFEDTKILFTGSSMTVLNKLIFVLWIIVSVLAAGAIGMTLYFFVDIFVPNHTKD